MCNIISVVLIEWVELVIILVVLIEWVELIIIIIIISSKRVMLNFKRIVITR